MKKIVFSIAVLTGALVMSCNNNKNRSMVDEIDVIEPEVVVQPEDNIHNTTVRDNDGNVLELSFDKSNDRATAKLNGEVISLKQDRMASGIRMHNDEYLYEEWQGHIVLKKDGKVVFDNKDEVTNSATNNEGKKLDMTFNNNNNTAAVVYNGETISLRADTTASGIRYSNPDYTYEEWQGHIVLKKNGEVVFDNKK